MNKLPMGESDLAALATMLRRVDFFSPLTVGQMEQILPYILLRAYEAGETVFRQGDAGDAFYVVYSGKTEVAIKKGWFFPAKATAVLREGDFFGEMALLSQEKRSASVKCLAPTKLFALVSADFKFVLKQNPQAAAEMARIAARRKYDSAA